MDQQESHPLTEIDTLARGSSDKASHRIDEMQHYLQSLTLPNPRDEPFTYAIVTELCEQIEATCAELKIPLHSGVAFGSDPDVNLEASLFPVPFTDASVITLSGGFISFCSHISKVIAQSLIHERKGELIGICIEPGRVYEFVGSDVELKRFWVEVIGAYAFGSGPLNVAPRFVAKPASFTRIQILRSMELFALTHEYAHHIGRHGKSQSAEAGGNPDAKNEELAADMLAIALTRHIGAKDQPQNLFAMSGAGAVILLKCLECVRRTRQIFRNGVENVELSATHPSVSERIAAFEKLDQSPSEVENTVYKQMRNDFSEIIDSFWVKLRPFFVTMHQDGLRPEADTTLNSNSVSSHLERDFISRF